MKGQSRPASPNSIPTPRAPVSGSGYGSPRPYSQSLPLGGTLLVTREPVRRPHGHHSLAGKRGKPGRRGQLPEAVSVVGIVHAEQPPPGCQPDLEELAQGLDAVAPGQLLALGAAARVIVDRDFMNPVAEPQDASRDLRLDL